MKRKFTKKKLDELRNQLVHKPQLVWDALDTKEKKMAFDFAERYKRFLDESKTEREAVHFIEAFAKKRGFKDIRRSKRGKNFYKIHRNKSIALAIAGKQPLVSGLNLVASHVDAPRLDLKQNPLYEQVDLAFLKTHYYGGIKKYQWLARPLALHGKILKRDGTHVDLRVGEADDDPIFTIADLLPHLSHKVQADKKVSEAFEGEKLNLLVGGLPIGDGETIERFKLAVLEHLFTRYGVVEEDLMCSELEAVPAGRARDVGWDRSLVGGYGQDDRVCAFASLEAVGEVKSPDSTAVALFVDKEEIGSHGSTGARSRFLEDFVADLFEVTAEPVSERTLRKCLMSSRAISADANSALDPDYQDVHEHRNASRIGYGVCITKFTGVRGKYGSSDANAEYLAEIRRLFNENKVVWQTGELGKVDEGGGGTIAKFLAVYGMEVLDCGTPLLSMHSPLEIAGKADIYMTFKGYRAFLR
jgi:aspartyl aminopeptidase